MIEIRKLNLNIDLYNNTAILNNDISVVKKLLLGISGINDDDIYLGNRKVFDNSDYFKERIYIDNTLTYLNTLNAKNVANYVLDNYSKVLIEDYFKEMVDKLNARFYVDYDKSYKFSPYGNSLCNMILALSISSVRIIFLPFNNFSDLHTLKEIKRGISDKKSNIFGDSVLNISKYKDILDNIIILSDDKYFNFTNDSHILCVYSDEAIDSIYKIYQKKNCSFFLKDILKSKEEYDKIKKYKNKEVSIFAIGEDYE